MPWGLYRFQQSRQLHFITFSCYRRQPFLNTPKAKHVFERSLEQTRRSYRFYLIGYVVMPEHVHLLVTEPERSTLAAAVQALKQSVSQKLIGHHGRFWQARYYDFNVRTSEKRVEKLNYIHRNPVKRGLVEKPEDWTWSSYRHYALDEECIVEIESPWTAYKRKHPKTDPTELSHIFEYCRPENVTLPS
jgi:putative transposase